MNFNMAQQFSEKNINQRLKCCRQMRYDTPCFSLFATALTAMVSLDYIPVSTTFSCV
jgi:hypothetical protein